MTTAEAGRLIAGLPERQRYVLQLRVVCGLSVERTAELVGVEPQDVLLLQHQALNALRRRLRTCRTGTSVPDRPTHV